VPKRGWKQVRTEGKVRLSHADSVAEARAILQSLEGNPKLRLSVNWTLEEESP
jgi:hypothetical protein